MKLRPYQERGGASIRDAFRRFRRVLYVAPTGSGKTVLFTYITHGAALKGNRVWILVHRAELLRQASAALTEQAVPHGILAAGHPSSPLPNAQICSVQSLASRIPGAIPPDLIICDECHHSPSATYRAVFDAFPKARVLGVTATPIRLDGQGLSAHYDTIVRGPEMQWLIDEGFLAKPALFVPPSALSMEGVKMVAGDFNSRQATERVDKPKITGDAVAHYTRLCAGKRAIAFCTGIAHAEHVRDQFRAAGYAWELLVGKPYMSESQRVNVSNALARGDLNGVSTVDLVSEGYDLPALDAAILLRPTASLGLYLQQVGRALRPAPGKYRALILDHVGNVARHGLPQESREWTLDGIPSRSVSDDGETYRQCPACYCWHETAPVCPECGHVHESRQRAPIETEQGDLSELTDERVAKYYAEQDRLREMSARKREEGQAQTLEELQALGRARGYKSGWAKHRWEARQRRQA